MTHDSTQPVAVITGAARGIGLASAHWFLAQGYRVVLLDNDAVTLAHTGAALTQQAGEAVLAIACDVSNEDQVLHAANDVQTKFKRIDALVNNAGIAVFKPIARTTLQEWRAVMATNLDGPFICAQAFLPLMRQSGGGSIVNIASISGLRASTLRVAYGTSKAAIIHLTKQQAVEFSSYGIRANAVAPGPVETAMAKQVHSKEIRTDYHNAVPLARYGSEEEIANTIGFLCSPQASYITGQIIAADGGFDAAGVGLPTFREQFAKE